MREEENEKNEIKENEENLGEIIFSFILIKKYEKHKKNI